MPGGIKSSGSGGKNIGAGGKSSPINVRSPAQLRQRVYLGYVDSNHPSGPSQLPPPQALLQIASHQTPSVRINFIPKPHS